MIMLKNKRTYTSDVFHQSTESKGYHTSTHFYPIPSTTLQQQQHINNPIRKCININFKFPQAKSSLCRKGLYLLVYQSSSISYMAAKMQLNY